MRKYFPFIAFLFVFGYAKAVDQAGGSFDIKDLSAGQYSYPSSNKIPDNSAALIQNFYTDIQPLATEMNGYTILDSGVGQANADGRGLWKFIDVNANEWIIEFSSKSFYKHTLGGAPTKFGLNAASTNLPRAAINLGRIWFVNGVDQLWWFDGTSTGTVSSAPVGKLILSWRTRIIISQVASTQSTLYFSEDGDGTLWTLGGNPTDPFTIQIGGANDGFKVTCMGIYSDYIITQRKYDSWIISGFDQSDVEVRNISDEVGCTEPGSNREFDGSYMFLSARGIEEMQGTVIHKVSEPIRDIVDNIVKNSNSQRSVIQTSQLDWAGGSIISGNAFYLDTTTVAGRVQLTFPDPFDSYRDGTSGSNKVWVSSQSFSSTATSTVTASGQLNIALDGGGFTEAYAQTVGTLSDFQVGTSYYVTISSLPFTGISSIERFWLVLSSNNFSTSTGRPDANSSHFELMWNSTSPTTATFKTILDDVGDSLMVVSTTAVIPFTFNFWISTSNYSWGVNGVQVSAGTHTWPHNNVYVALAYQHGGNGGTQPATLVLDDFSVAPQTVTFQTSLFSVGTAITAWGNMDISDDQTNPTGSIVYQFGSTSTANVNSISNFTTTANHSVPSVSTNSFAAVRAVFNETNTGSFPSSFDDITVNWLEGAAPAMASVVYDGRYWLAYTDQLGSLPVNNKDLIYQRNRTWVTATIPAASFAIWRDHLYFGDSASNGNYYQFDVGDTYNGSPITSLINFKSYDLGAPNKDKDLNRAYLTFLGNQVFLSTFTLSYTVDEGTIPYSLGSANMNDGNGQVFEKFWFPLDGSAPLQGRELQYVFNKTGTGDRIKLFDIVTNYRLKEER